MTVRHWLINPTWRCQNHCSYCWLNGSVRTRPEMMRAQERPLADWVHAIQRDRIEIVDIAGGEPLLLGWLAGLLDMCPQTVFGLSTNGLDMRALRVLSAQPHPNLVAINVSYHPDTAQRLPDYDARWQGAVLLLRDMSLPVHCNVVMYPDVVERSERMLAWMRQKQILHELSPYEDVGSLGIPQATGLCCQGGVNHMTVAPDGSAWPCLSTLRSPYAASMCLGNWLDGMIDLSRKPQPCHLQCVDYFVLPSQHSAGDMWRIEAKPCAS